MLGMESFNVESPPFVFSRPDPLHLDESDRVLAVQSFNSDMMILATHLGQLARHLRNEAARRSSFAGDPNLPPKEVEIRRRQQQVEEMLQALRRTWRNQIPPGLETAYQNRNLSERVRLMFEHVSVKEGSSAACPSLSYGHT